MRISDGVVKALRRFLFLFDFFANKGEIHGMAQQALLPATPLRFKKQTDTLAIKFAYLIQCT